MAESVVILAAFVIDELMPVVDFHVVICKFNWLPSRYQMASLIDFVGIPEGIWPFASLAYLSLTMFPQHRYQAAFLGGLIMVSVAAALEWMQQFIPGRYPDITQVLLATVGWSLPWIVVEF